MSRPWCWTVASLVGGLVACTPEVEVTVGEGREADARRVLTRVMGVAPPERLGARGGLLVPAVRASAAAALLSELGLDQPRATPPPRIVVGPSEAAARERLVQVRRFEDALTAAPDVVLARIMDTPGSALVTVWSVASAPHGAGEAACVLAREGLGPHTRCAVRALPVEPPSPDRTPDVPRLDVTVWASLACLGVSAVLTRLAWRARAGRSA